MTTPVFDYAASLPWVPTDSFRDGLEAAAADGRRAVYDYVRRERTAQLITDPAARAGMRDRLDEAGVNLVSVTMPGALSSRWWRDHFATWQAIFDASDWLHKVRSPAHARRVVADGEVGVLLNTQNLGFAIDGDVDEVDAMYGAGYRIFQLTYNRQNRVGTGCYARADAHLSNHGVGVVERLNDLGGIVDLSHCGPATTLDAVALSDAPVAYTHVACEALYDHPRAKSDEELRALADADGYVGIVGVPWFLAPDGSDPELDVFVEHVAHAASVVGVERVGIGTDFVNVDADAPEPYLAVAAGRASGELGFPEGYGSGYGGGFGEMRHYADWGLLREALAAHFSDREVRRICGENFLAFWERVVGA